MDAPSPLPPFSTISDVERDTGVAKETLRVWERRYGFPRPQRDANDERVYPADQVLRLRQVRRLLDLGHRPGKLLNLTAGELEALANPAPPPVAPVHADLQPYVDLILRHDTQSLRRQLTYEIQMRGLRDFIIGLAGPLTRYTGEAWANGSLAVYEEHLFSEVLELVLHHAIHGLGRRGGSPRILLTTVPQERHGLGLLMAEAIFTLDGAHCISLGVSTPVFDIVQAAREADIVALSFTAQIAPRSANDALVQLRAALPPSVQLWAGGAGARLARRLKLDGLRILDLDEVGPALDQWRAEHTRAL